MRDLRRLRGTVIVALIGTVVFTGCADEQQAKDTLPSMRPAETTEALPQLGPADFPVPDEARTKDAAGAEAFFRYWIDLLNRQQTIPAGQPLRDLGPTCVECGRIARVYDEAAAAGRRYVGGHLSVGQSVPPFADGAEMIVSFFARLEAVQLVEASGAVVQAADVAPDLSSGIRMSWSEAKDSWLVVSFTLG